MATVTPDGKQTNPQPDDKPRTTRELVIRIKLFTLLVAVAVVGSSTVAYFNPKLGGALAVGATILAAIYAVLAFNKRR